MKYLDYISNHISVSIPVFVTLIPILAMILNRNWKLKTPLRFFFYYLIFGRLIIDLMAIYLASNRINNLMLCNASILINYLFIASFFNSVFLDDKTKGIIKGVSIFFILVFFSDLIYSTDNWLDYDNYRYVSFSTSLRSIFIILFCLLFFHELVVELYLNDLSRSAIFFIVCGLFIYHSISVFTTILYNKSYRWEYDHSMDLVLYIPYYFESLFLLISSIGIIRNKNNYYIEE